jgi:hypothetical protein
MVRRERAGAEACLTILLMEQFDGRQRIEGRWSQDDLSGRPIAHDASELE